MDIHIDLNNVTVRTRRLLIRPFALADLTDFFAYACVPGVGERAGWPHHETIETSDAILRSFIEQREVLAIALKDSGKVIGSLGLHVSWANEDPRFSYLFVKEVGYVLSKDHWGQGLMPEAVQGLIGFCFGELGLEALSCAHFKDNGQSRRVIEKCGFSFVKEGTCYSGPLKRSFDDRRYILLRGGPGGIY